MTRSNGEELVYDAFNYMTDVEWAQYYADALLHARFERFMRDYFHASLLHAKRAASEEWKACVQKLLRR